MESWWWVLLLLGFGGGFRILDLDEDCFSSILGPASPPPQITTSCLSPPPRWGEETSEKRERARMRKLEGAIYCHGPPHNINCLLWRIQQSIRYLEEGEIISLKLIRLLPLENYISSKPNPISAELLLLSRQTFWRKHKGTLPVPAWGFSFAYYNQSMYNSNVNLLWKFIIKRF